MNKWIHFILFFIIAISFLQSGYAARGQADKDLFPTIFWGIVGLVCSVTAAHYAGVV